MKSRIRTRTVLRSDLAQTICLLVLASTAGCGGLLIWRVKLATASQSRSNRQLDFSGVHDSWRKRLYADG